MNMPQSCQSMSLEHTIQFRFEAMLEGLRSVSDGVAVSFVRQFYGVPSQYIWEDYHGVIHDISQGEGGEQGDPFMSCSRWGSIVH